MGTYVWGPYVRGTFCPLGRLVSWDILSVGYFVLRDVLSVGTYVWGPYVRGTFCPVERFVSASLDFPGDPKYCGLTAWLWILKIVVWWLDC